jgi:hypothetical protein
MYSGMYKVDVNAVDPASVAHGHWVGLAAVGVTALVCALLVMRLGWRSWWAVIAAAVVVPTIAVLAAGGAHPGESWPLTEFIVDVVTPLVVLGFAAAVIGSAAGALLRRLLRRNTT